MTLYQYHHMPYSRQRFGILLNEAGSIGLGLSARITSHRYNGRWCLCSPDLEGRGSIVVRLMQPQELWDD